MADYEDLPHIVIETRGDEGGRFGTLLLGVLLGAGAALLLAPRSGVETQREILSAARRVRGQMESRANDAREQVTGLVDRTRGRVRESVESVRDAVESRADQARAAVMSGRDAARQARGELQRRVDEAKAAYRAGVEGQPPTERTVPRAVVITDVSSEPGAGDLA